MKPGANPVLGETRSCPHCKQKILKSAVACPICHHFLRFDAVRGAHKSRLTARPLGLEWSLAEPASARPCEYSVIVAVHDGAGAEISRQVAAIGVLAPSEARTFKIWVEIFSPDDAEGKARS